jgi:ectoine hydroxylase-related dioxygenase (phytanoyl-CoA dioxygenase family)
MSAANIYDLTDGEGVQTIENFLSLDDCSSVKNIILDYEPDALGSVRCLFDKSHIFQSMITDKRLTNICESLFQVDYRLSALGARVIRPHCEVSSEHKHVQSPHIDYPYPSVIGDNEGRNSPYFGIPLGLQVLIPLVDLTLENGATAYIPGSHKWYTKPKHEMFYDLVEKGRGKRLVIPAGTAALWAGPLWHCAMHNNSTNDRVVVTMMLAPAFINHPHLMRDTYSDEFTSTLESNVRKLLSLDDPVPHIFKQPKRKTIAL